MTLRALRSYVPWQALDLLPRALAPLALFAVFAGIPIAAMLKSAGKPMGVDPENQAAFIKAVYISMAPLCMTLGAFLFMTAGLAVDRERQHLRFYFAHPVSPVAYYLQRFLVGLVISAVCFLPIPYTMRALGGDVPVIGTVVALLATLVLIGGLAMLCAAITNKDGLALILAYVGTQAVQQLPTSGILVDVMRPIGRVLPPLAELDALRKMLLESSRVPWTDLILVFGYGIGLLVAALFVIRRAALVR